MTRHVRSHRSYRAVLHHAREAAPGAITAARVGSSATLGRRSAGPVGGNHCPCCVDGRSARHHADTRPIVERDDHHHRGHRAGDAHSLLRFAVHPPNGCVGRIAQLRLSRPGHPGSIDHRHRHAGQVRRQRGDDALSRRTGRNRIARLRRCTRGQDFSRHRALSGDSLADSRRSRAKCQICRARDPRVESCSLLFIVGS